MCAVPTIFLFSSQDKQRQISEKKVTLDNLKSRLDTLLAKDVAAVIAHVEPMYELWTPLRNAVDSLRDRRKDSYGRCQVYHGKQLDVGRDVDRLLTRLEVIQMADDIPASKKIVEIQVGPLPLLNSFY